MNIDPIEELRHQLDAARKDALWWRTSQAQTAEALDMANQRYAALAQTECYTREQLQPLLTCLRCIEDNCRIAPGEDTVAALAPKCIFSESAARSGLQHAKSIGLVKEDK